MQSFHLKSHTIIREYACRDIVEAHNVTELFLDLNRYCDEDIVNADVKDINGHATNAVVIETLNINCDHRITDTIYRYIKARLPDDEFKVLECLDFDRWISSYLEIKQPLDNLVSKGYAEKDDCRGFYRRVK